MLYNIKTLPLHCVFHGIRFKVNEDWVSVIDTLLFFVCILIIFLLPEQKKNEANRKFAVCIFLPTPALFSAKQKELASLKQLFVFNATKSTSASRQKKEDGPLSFFGEGKLCFARFRVICLMYLRRNSREKTHTPQTAKRI